MRKLTSFDTLAFVFGLLCLLIPASTIAQAQQPTLVIEGGTLIDGNGGAPVQDALIVIQGNRITNVSRRGQATYPATVPVIRADGKFILPGYWEVENVHMWYVGESLLNHGVTSISDIAESGVFGMLHREAVNRGKINGPRLFTGIARMGSGVSFEANMEFVTPYQAGQPINSAEHARAIARRLLAAGADLINLQGGNLPVEYYRAAIEEGLKAGKPSSVRAGGPLLFPKDAMAAGATILSQATGIENAIVKDSSQNGRGGAPQDTLEVYADMDDVKAAELIRLMVQNKATVHTNLIRKGKGFHKYNDRFQEEARRWWHDNPNLRAYFPEEMFESEMLEMTPDEMQPEVFARRAKGYQNMLRFYNQFVQAGGRIMAGCNAPFIRPPGLCMHQELQIFADAGLKPMQVIQAATKWPAEAYGALDRLGTIATGKLADIVILNSDPLQDQRNLKDINTVIFDGKTQKLGYTVDFALSQPFKGGPGLELDSIVEDLAWVKALKGATFREGAPMPTAPPGGPVRVNPPAIETISPVFVKQGTPTTLTIKGFNFFDRCLVYFGGEIVPYRRVSPTELQVTLDPSLVQRPGTYEIFVKTPGPLVNQQSWHARDGLSNKAHFLVDFVY
jgi:hypothetical protein